MEVLIKPTGTLSYSFLGAASGASLTGTTKGAGDPHHGQQQRNNFGQRRDSLSRMKAGHATKLEPQSETSTTFGPLRWRNAILRAAGPANRFSITPAQQVFRHGGSPRAQASKT